MVGAKFSTSISRLTHNFACENTLNLIVFGRCCRLRIQCQGLLSYKATPIKTETQTHRRTQVATGCGVNPGLFTATCDGIKKLHPTNTSWEHFNHNICHIYFSESITGKYGQNNTSRTDYWKPALLWGQLCLRYYQSQTTRWPLIFLSSQTVSTLRVTALHHTRTLKTTMKTPTSLPCRALKLPISHLPTHHCLWATGAFLRAETPHSIWLSECLFRLVETIAPAFSAGPWPGAMPLPVLYLPQSLCYSQFSQHASRSADDTVSAAVVFMQQHLDTSGTHLNTVQSEY